MISTYEHDMKLLVTLTEIDLEILCTSNPFVVVFVAVDVFILFSEILKKIQREKITFANKPIWILLVIARPIDLSLVILCFKAATTKKNTTN